MGYLIDKKKIYKNSVIRKKKAALMYHFIHRKNKKNKMKILWIHSIKSHLSDLSYSNFIAGLHDSKLKMNHKMLSSLAMNEYISCFMTINYTLISNLK